MFRILRGTQMSRSIRRNSKGGSLSTITHGLPSISKMSPI
jgi:hypothetical protein